MAIKITMEEFEDANNGYMGICLNCSEFREETEPDAENYECDYCGEEMVMGVELALVSGEVKIEDE